jgi:hypothetical protein
MSDSPASSPNRSRASLLFEAVVQGAMRSEPIPSIADIEFSRIGRYAPWVATVDPNVEARSLKIVQAGARLAKLMGRDNLIGREYLTMVDPAIKDLAFDSVLEMMTRPCGLWQVTPVIAANDTPVDLEYTGFPVREPVSGRTQIMFLVYHPSVTRVDRDALPRPAQVQHSEVWCWLSMRAEFAAATSSLSSWRAI